jgi:hypothetical protein
MKSLLLGAAICVSALPFVVDTLEDARDHQERTVQVYEENFGHLSDRPATVRKQWDIQKKEVTLQLDALRIFIDSLIQEGITRLPQQKSIFVDPPSDER